MNKDDDTLLDMPRDIEPEDQVDLPAIDETLGYADGNTPTTQFPIHSPNTNIDPDNRKTDGIPVISDVGVTTERELVSFRYEIIERIGGGAMAEVFRARDNMLSLRGKQHEVALKVFADDNPWGDQADARIKTEVALARRVVSPHVAQVFDLTKFPDGRWAIVQELVRGKTLTAIMNEGFEIDWLRLTRWNIEIAKAIHAAHKVGVVHRDLKPENIMIQGADDSAKTLDFGVAKLFGPRGVSLTKHGNVVGTLLYMAPEQIRNQTDPRSDIYALGLTMFRLAAGFVPRSGDRTADGIILARVHEPEPVHLRDYVPDAPLEFANVVDRMLMTHPRDRFQTGADIVEELRAFLEVSSAKTQVMVVSDFIPPTVVLDCPPRPPPPSTPSLPISVRIRRVPSNEISVLPANLAPREATPATAGTPPRMAPWFAVLLAALLLMLIVLLGPLAKAAEGADQSVRSPAAIPETPNQPRTTRG